MLKIEVINIMYGPEAKISFHDEEVGFTVTPFGKDNFKVDMGLNSYDVFSHINAYWSTLPEQDQKYIFGLYRGISMIFQSGWNMDALSVALNEKTVELLNFHTEEKLKNWMVYKSDIQIPSSIKTVYEESVDRSGSRKQTYLQSDYSKLIVAVLALRTVIPIWGEYIAHTRNMTGTRFKEYYAFQLINNSNLVEGEAFNKLREYIALTIGNEGPNPADILDGISSEDYNPWMLAIVSVRRLCMGDIRGIDPHATLVTSIWKFVAQKGKGDTNVEKMVKEKISSGGNDEDRESKLSSFERFKIKHPIPPGDVVAMEFIVRDNKAVAYRLTQLMSDDLLELSLRTSAELMNHEIGDPQIELLSWIMAPVIPPRGVLYLSKSTIVRLLGITQAVLWARGHKYLALISTSFVVKDRDSSAIANQTSRTGIHKDLVDKLDQLYPYHKVVGGRKSGMKEINLATRSIDALVEKITSSPWMMTADDTLINDCLGTNNSRRLPISRSIKNDIAQLVVEIGGRTWI